MGRRKKEVVVGIDSGLTGFVSVIDVKNGAIIQTFSTKVLPALFEKLRFIKKSFSIKAIGLEKVTGGASGTPVQAGKLMRNYGQIEAFITSLELVDCLKYYTPNQWQKYLKAQVKEKDNKKASKELASKLWGKNVRNHNEADSICIGFVALKELTEGSFFNVVKELSVVAVPEEKVKRRKKKKIIK